MKYVNGISEVTVYQVHTVQISTVFKLRTKLDTVNFPTAISEVKIFQCVTFSVRLI